MWTWLWVLLIIGLALDIVGTGVAAWFLTSYWLLGLMVVAAIGWFVCLFAGGPTSREQTA